MPLNITMGGIGAFRTAINTAIFAATAAARVRATSTGEDIVAELELGPGQTIELRIDVLGTLTFGRTGQGYEVEVPVAYAAPVQLALGLPEARLRNGRAVWCLAPGVYGPATVQNLLRLGLRVS